MWKLGEGWQIMCLYPGRNLMKLDLCLHHFFSNRRKFYAALIPQSNKKLKKLRLDIKIQRIWAVKTSILLIKLIPNSNNLCYFESTSIALICWTAGINEIKTFPQFISLQPSYSFQSICHIDCVYQWRGHL